jgi:N-acetylmuramoyl-L-alanine amidase
MKIITIWDLKMMELMIMDKVQTGASQSYEQTKEQVIANRQYREKRKNVEKLSPEEQRALNREAEKKQLQEEIDNLKTNPYLIVVDAGHGGDAVGSQFGPLVEKNINLNVALKVKSIITRNEYKVLMTRTKDSKTPNNKRWQIANKMNASVFISIHTNSAKPFFHGASIITPKGHDQDNSFYLAYKIYMRMSQAGITMTTDSIYQDRRGLEVLNATKMPAIIVEIGYIRGDAENLTKKTYIKNMAWSIAYGITDYICTYLKK